MPGPLDWWNRIRRVVGPPGAPATRAAVPTALGAAQRAELAAVFAHVDELENELRLVERQRVDETTAIATAARKEAERLIGDARTRAAAASWEAVAQHRRATDDEATRLRSDAAARVAELRQASAGSIPTVVADAVERVRAFAAGGSAGTRADCEHLR